MNTGQKNQPLQIFSPKVFECSNRWEISTQKLFSKTIYLIDSFYSNISAVRHEINKLPVCQVGLPETFEETKDHFFLGRKSHVVGMRGTIPPYRDQLNRHVTELLDLEKQNLEELTIGDILVNVFQKGPLYDEDSYCFAHLDPPVDAVGMVALLIFLNEHYEEGEGFSFYSLKKPVEKFNSTYGTTYCPKELLNIDLTIQGKENRAILFPGDQFIHGQRTPTKQFCNETRYAQAIFMNIYPKKNYVYN